MEAEAAGLRWGSFKPLLADALVAHLEPIQKRWVLEPPTTMTATTTPAAACAPVPRRAAADLDLPAAAAAGRVAPAGQLGRRGGPAEQRCLTLQVR